MRDVRSKRELSLPRGVSLSKQLTRPPNAAPTPLGALLPHCYPVVSGTKMRWLFFWLMPTLVFGQVSAPVDLEAMAAGRSSVRLLWRNRDSYDLIQLFASRSLPFVSSIDTLSGNAETFEIDFSRYGLVPGGAYFFKLRGVVFGEGSADSDVISSCVVVALEPSRPTSINQGSSVIWEWVGDDRGRDAQVWLGIDSDSNFSNGGYSWVATGQGEDGSYSWNTESSSPNRYYPLFFISDGSNSGYDYGARITVKAAAPGKVTLQSPPDGSDNLPVDVALAWREPAFGLVYDVQVDDDSSFSTPEFERIRLGATSVLMEGLEHSRPYHWRVRARRGSRPGPWSEVWSFSTEPAAMPPGQVVLSQPADGSGGLPPEVLLRWEAPPGDLTLEFEVQLALDLDFTSVEFHLRELGALAAAVGDLDLGSRYYWRVRAANEDGVGEWSAPFSFRVRNAITDPSPPDLERVWPESSIHSHPAGKPLSFILDAHSLGASTLKSVAWYLGSTDGTPFATSALDPSASTTRATLGVGSAIPQDGDLTLTIPAGNIGFGQRVEYISQDKHGPGIYQAEIKAASGAPEEGVLTSMFVYDGLSENEVTLEIFGDDPEIVFSAFWYKREERITFWLRPLENLAGMKIDHQPWEILRDGDFGPVSLRERLSHFASRYTSDYLEYRIDWRPEGITLSIEDKPIWTIPKDAQAPPRYRLPIHSGNMIFSLWNAPWDEDGRGRDGDPFLRQRGAVPLLSERVAGVRNVEIRDLDGDVILAAHPQGLSPAWTRTAGFYAAGARTQVSAVVHTQDGARGLLDWQIQVEASSDEAAKPPSIVQDLPPSPPATTEGAGCAARGPGSETLLILPVLLFVYTSGLSRATGDA